MQIFVGTTSLEKYFNVVLVFSQIRRVLLEVNHRSGPSETVFWECLSLSEVLTLVGVEFSREFVAVYDSENASINV